MYNVTAQIYIGSTKQDHSAAIGYNVEAISRAGRAVGVNVRRTEHVKGVWAHEEDTLRLSVVAGDAEGIRTLARGLRNFYAQDCILVEYRTPGAGTHSRRVIESRDEPHTVEKTGYAWTYVKDDGGDYSVEFI